MSSTRDILEIISERLHSISNSLRTVEKSTAQLTRELNQLRRAQQNTEATIAAINAKLNKGE